MNLGSSRTILVATGTGVLWLMAVAMAIGQAGPGPRPQMAEEVFKNVQVLKGIPVDEFMGTMGVFSAALGLSCEDCHEANDSNWANYALDTGPKKRTARRMVLMMTAINRDQLRRTAGRDLLHLPSRQHEPQGHTEPGGALRRRPCRRDR